MMMMNHTEESSSHHRRSFSAHHLCSENHDSFLLDDSVHIGAEAGAALTEGAGGPTPPEAGLTSLAPREYKAVWCLRGFVLVLLTSSALAVCLSVYFVTRNLEKEDFEQSFQDIADKTVESIGLNLKLRFRVFDHFAMDLATMAATSGNSSSWPFVAIQPGHFYHLARSSAILSDTFSISLLPLVSTEQKPAWLDHVRNYTDWLKESMVVQNNDPSLADANVVPPPVTDAEPIQPHILNVGSQGLYEVTDEPGPYAPIFHNYPATSHVVFGLNLLAHPHYRDALELLVSEKRPILPPSYDFLDAEKAAKDPRKPMIDSFINFYGIQFDNDPVMPLCYPVFNDLGQNHEVVAIMVWGVYWKTYFRQILPDSAAGIVVVLENTCGQQYTYQIDGDEARFLSHGDVHDSRYDDLEVSGVLKQRSGAPEEEDGAKEDDKKHKAGECLYSVRVYPSREFEDSHTTDTPEIFAVALAAVFIFCGIFFVVYDRCLELRQEKVSKSALRSGRIVNELFPETVREMLYEAHEATSRSTSKLCVEDDLRTRSTVATITSSPTRKPKADKMEMTTAEKQEHIANLYPHCSILFADIAGFTKWSSTRSPGAVFSLLEALYGQFDQIAKVRGVFKVETIGDCYVAATGLPKDQPTHAVLLVRFARAARNRMVSMLPDLACSLGEDTNALAMRFGIHSGPVTAGVLRGEKSRFQIFGDTVNTAARMESTGERDLIQVSDVTAKLLVEAGKEHWIKPRRDAVHAKGLGLLQTYWIRRGVNESPAPRTSCSSLTDDDGSLLSCGRSLTGSLPATIGRNVDTSGSSGAGEGCASEGQLETKIRNVPSTTARGAKASLAVDPLPLMSVSIRSKGDSTKSGGDQEEVPVAVLGEELRTKLRAIEASFHERVSSNERLSV